jgi:hypothetical protein
MIEDGTKFAKAWAILQEVGAIEGNPDGVELIAVYRPAAEIVPPAQWRSFKPGDRVKLTLDYKDRGREMKYFRISSPVWEQITGEELLHLVKTAEFEEIRDDFVTYEMINGIRSLVFRPFAMLAHLFKEKPLDDSETKETNRPHRGPGPQRRRARRTRRDRPG